MAGGRRVLMSSMDGVEFSGDGASISDMMFGFYEVGSSESCTSDDLDGSFEDGDGEKGEEEVLRSSEENKAYWEKQQQLIHVTLSRTRSLESGIRRATKEALKAMQSTQTICICRIGVTGQCRNCLLSYVSDHLRNSGYDSAICKAKWRSSSDIPSGEHTYIDVVDNSNPEKGEVRVVIELNFRAEFEMARASEEYNRLIAELPEIFVGRADRLRAVIKIICSAGKKCMKEKKMHMGPWRKQKYMDAKWFGRYKRTVATPAPALPVGLVINRLQRPRASLLTFDLLDNLPGLHYTAVEVL